MLAVLASIALAAAAQEPPPTPTPEPPTPEPAAVERWRCTLAAGEASLPFVLELEGDRAFVRNGDERVPVPVFERGDASWRLAFPHYDSEIVAEATGGADHLVGTWRKTRGPGVTSEVHFSATRGAPTRFEPVEGLAPTPASVAGRWRIRFEGDASPAVLLLEPAGEGASVHGTVLTRTGDHRYLAGDLVAGPRLRLSCFDGAHAFLYEAALREDGTLGGTFRSGDWFARDFTATRDDAVELPDAFEEVHRLERASLGDLAFPDVDGEETRVADLLGRVTLVQVLGSWCPNCHDETRFLTELLEEHRSRGLAVVGLAFELTGDGPRDRAQIDRFVKSRGVPYPVLYAGSADKRDAAEALGLIDRVLAFPTTLFVDANGRVRAVHSGFTGPAAGAEHRALRAEFEARVEELLVEPPGRSNDTWGALSTVLWTDRTGGPPATWTFRDAERGTRELRIETQGPNGRPGEPVVESVRVRGDLVWVGRHLWVFDPRALVLRDPRDWGARIAPQAVPPTPLVDPDGVDDDALEAALRSEDALVRREAAWALGARRDPGGESPWTPLAPLLDDPDLGVRLAATWAIGASGERGALDALVERLDSPHPGQRRETARALRALGRLEPLPEAVEERLDEVHRTDPVRTVRAAARAD